MIEIRLLCRMVCIATLMSQPMFSRPTFADQAPSETEIRAALEELGFERSDGGDRLRRWLMGPIIFSFGFVQQYRWVDVGDVDYQKSLSQDQAHRLMAVTSSVERRVRQIVAETGLPQETNRDKEGSFAIDFISKYTYGSSEIADPFTSVIVPSLLSSLNGRTYQNSLSNVCIGRTGLYDRPFSLTYMFEGEIDSATLWVNLDALPDEIEKCVKLETFRLIGLSGNVTSSADSVFGESVTDTDAISSFDRSLIRLLYSPRLTPGMTRDEVSKALGSPP